ncbi:MAG: hypothetical protein ACK448_07390 [Bacteroidota bacterium]|jgi:hypothetical protein
MKIKQGLLVGCSVVGLLFGACGSKPSADQSIRNYSLDEVRSVLKSQISAWSTGDINGFMDGYIKDSTVRFITSKKVKSSWQQILSDYKKGYPTKEAMGNLDFLLDEVRWLDSSAGLSQVIGRWQVLQVRGDKKNILDGINQRQSQLDTLSGRFSLIFKSTQQGPRIAIDCTW